MDYIWQLVQQYVPFLAGMVNGFFASLSFYEHKVAEFLAHMGLSPNLQVGTMVLVLLVLMIAALRLLAGIFKFVAVIVFAVLAFHIIQNYLL